MNAQPANPVIAFPATQPDLRLAGAERDDSVSLAVERQTLEQDHEALRDREANLQDYEVRLRLWQAQIESGLQQPPAGHYVAPISLGRVPSVSPFEGDASLQAGWEKLHRARELLEAEQAHVRDDRLNLKETAIVLKRHEAALAAREANVARREVLLANPPAQPEEIVVKVPSALSRLTGVPFAIAKSVFGGKTPEQE